MKLFFTAVIAFAAGITFFSIFQRSCSKPVTAGTCVTNICTDYSNAGTFNRLNAQLVHVMASKYRNTAGTVDNAMGTNLPDARSIWFDLDSLKRFIWEIETNACRNACSKNPLNLGVRMYYARYPVTGSLSPFADLQYLPANYHEMHTLFMVPTYDSSGNPDCHIDFDPRYFADECNPISLKSLLPDEASRMANSIVALSGSTILNHGGVCPPICCEDRSSYFDHK